MYGMKKEMLETVVKELREAREALVVKLADLDKTIETLERMYPGEPLAAVNDYRKALHDLTTRVIAIENDPAVSSTAKARADRLAALEKACKTVKTFLDNLVRAIRRRVHAHLHKALDEALK